MLFMAHQVLYRPHVREMSPCDRFVYHRTCHSHVSIATIPSVDNDIDKHIALQACSWVQKHSAMPTATHWNFICSHNHNGDSNVDECCTPIFLSSQNAIRTHSACACRVILSHGRMRWGYLLHPGLFGGHRSCIHLLKIRPGDWTWCGRERLGRKESWRRSDQLTRREPLDGHPLHRRRLCRCPRGCHQRS